MPTLKLTNNSTSYQDLPPTSNPQKVYFDQSSRRSVTVSNPKSEAFTVDPFSTLQLFSGLRATSIDNTTEFTIALSPLSNTTYRFTNTAGTAPSLRTNRNIDLSTHATTMTVNANLTLSMAATTGDFTSVLAGDTLFIPGVTTGDPLGPFNPLNEGYWTVLSKDPTSTTLQLSRPANETFVGITETVTPTLAGQVLAFSAAGVQQGDKVTISMGFPSSVFNTYTITAVTPTWFEAVSTLSLPVGVAAIPTIAGIAFYTNAKRWIRMEVDQNAVVQLNGDTGNTNTLTPWEADDANQTGAFEKSGPCWSASIVNQSAVQMNLLFLSVE